MPLPASWVDSLFARLLVRYGDDWLRKWNGVPMDAVKADWASALDGMTPPAISYALEHLPPDRPPTATQFRVLARGRPDYFEHKQLPAPKATDTVVAEVVSKALAPKPGADPKAQARRLRERELAGERLNPFQRSAWREALRNEPEGQPQ